MKLFTNIVKKYKKHKKSRDHFFKNYGLVVVGVDDKLVVLGMI